MKIKDIFGILHFDTVIVITNKTEGKVFEGYPEELTDELENYRVVVLKAEGNKTIITAVK